MKKLVFIALGLSLAACNRKQMEITRASYTVVENVNDHSPVYFEEVTGYPDSVSVNHNNEITGTNFIISVSRDLNLLKVLKEVQAIKDKKYKEKLHKDDKGIFFTYADTLHKQLAFFPIHDIAYGFERPQTNENVLYINASNDCFFEDIPIDKKELTLLLKEKDSIQLGFSQSLSFEKYLQFRILLQESNLQNKFLEKDLVY